MTCPHCHGEVPAAPYCVRCGEPLQNSESPYPVEGRGYAALPSERWFEPRIVSSIFPHLPRRDMSSFRASLVIGVAAIVGLSAFNLFSLALVVAAVTVPFLCILYLWDVDLYEDAPLPVLGATIAWGILAGFATGLAARHLQSPVRLLDSGVSTHDVVWLGIVLPVASFGLMCLGPLALLPYRRFNDVLDGVTFGAASAVTFLAAEAITNSADVLRDGVTPPGDESLWIARLLTLGIALPVLGAAVVATACGVLWLRYRAPQGGQQTLGLVGRVWIGLPVATGALVAASLSVVYLSQWQALGVTAVLAAASLIGLRRAVDLGLRQEAAEIEIGPAIHCTNCGRETPAHTFCAHCGVALSALPKHGAVVPSAPRPAGVRIPRRALPGAFAVLVAATIGISLLVIELFQPEAVQPPCDPGVPCAHALQASSASGPPTIQSEITWKSKAGPSARYDPQSWEVESSGEYLYLVHGGRNHVEAFIWAFPATTSPQEMLARALDFDKKHTLGLELDAAADHVLMGPQIGSVPATAVMYKATVDAPPSPSQRYQFAYEITTYGGATVLIRAITNEVPHSSDDKSNEARSPFPSYYLVDRLMDTFAWNTGA